MPRTDNDTERMAGVLPAGGDPDSRQRLAKHLVAAGLPAGELPDGLSVEPVTDEDREAHRIEVERHREAAEKRQAAAEAAQAKAQDDANESTRKAADDDAARTRPPQGRTASPGRATAATE